MPQEDVHILSQETIHSGYFTINRYNLKIKTYDGGHSELLSRELVERQEAVAVLLYDPKQDQVVLIEQFRIGLLNSDRNPWIIEVVAGLVDENEALVDVAKRETWEEAGIKIEEIQAINSYWSSPGGSSERTHFFCAKVDATTAGGIHGLAEEGEDIKVVVMRSEDAIARVNDGTICSAHTIIALQWLALHKHNLFQ
ncbi:MAG: NUDIX domain-containing protein [Pseudomonadota bacterium]